VQDARKSVRRTDISQGTGNGSDGSEPMPGDIAVETLLNGRREVVLVHNGARYRLRITSNDKLILTK
jgi:hemin uptake protein HemP